MNRVKNPFCLDPTETSCPRLARLGLKFNTDTGTLVQSTQELTKSNEIPKSLVEKTEIENWGNTVDNKILPQKANVTEITETQMKSAKLTKAASIYYKDGFQKAQDYLGEDYKIIQAHSGKFHITVENTETGDYEISIRGIEFGNPEDLLDLTKLTTNPNSVNFLFENSM